MPTYRIYGFILDSDIALPALPQVERSDADVTICAGDVPETAGLQTSFRNWEAEPGRFFAIFHETGRFLVTGGNTIRYHRFDTADDSQVVSVLLGTCMAALLMQRRIVPIHSCSVLTDKGAVLVMGMSGAGKSTMLGGLLSLGLPMMADDVTGLVLAGTGAPTAVPAFPATRLWKDSLDYLGHDSTDLPRVRSDMAKYYRSVPQFHDRPEPIRAITYLQASNRPDPQMGLLEPEKRVECVSRFIHRKNFIDGMQLRRWAFETVTKTVRHVPIFHLLRPSHRVEPSELAQMILHGIDQNETVATEQI
uniref:hypothetical protein n=1 Tax=Parerythrobacter lutipelagi TaxID=1964208 RepID=UPI0013756D58|nr:hypothetical protein [Parerythrobacter lutipelagi]